MPSIKQCALPEDALLVRYASAGGYVDCYTTEVPGAVTHADYVIAFYTTALFKMERIVLKWVVARPSADLEVRQLAEGASDTFAAWHVESRADNQILLCDYLGRTRSWLMVTPLPASGSGRTRLYFGSAVIPVRNTRTGRSTMGFGFHTLLGFHKLYSRALLYAAKSSVQSSRA